MEYEKKDELVYQNNKILIGKSNQIIEAKLTRHINKIMKETI